MRKTLQTFLRPLVATLFFSTLMPIPAAAFFWGPSTPDECIRDYASGVMPLEIKRMLRRACFMGYGSQDEELAKVGRCVAKSGRDLDTRSAAQKLMTKCARKYNSQRALNMLSFAMNNQ